MRDIMFRGKKLETGAWVYGGISFYKQYVKTLKEDKAVVYIQNGGRVDPNTVSQYTGLKDKNGIRIFEGDIIDINQTVNGCNLFEIVWDKTRWNAKYVVEMVKPRLYEYDFNELLDVDAEEKEIEVVGNIYEGERK